MSEKILVTGATGTVGSQTVAALKRLGAEFSVAVRDEAKAASLAAPAVRFDWEAPDTWATALKGVRALFLLTPPLHPREVEVGKALVDAARAAGVRRIVKLSAAGVENNPQSSHRQVELHVEASDVPWTHLRPTFFDQNFSGNHAQTIKERNAIFLPAGKGKTGFVDARDIGEVAARVLTGSGHHGKAYVLTGPAALDHDEVAAAIGRASGKQVRYHDMADAEFRAALGAHGVPAYGVEFMSSLYGFVRAGYTAGVSGDVAAILGKPPISFEQFAADHAHVWR